IVHKVGNVIPTELVPMFVPLSNGIAWVSEAGGTRIGDTVVIQGPGQHGLGCVVAAKEAGAGTIVVTGLGDGDDRRLEVARELGADVTLRVDKVDVVNAVADLTNGEMADVVIQVTERAPDALPSAVQLAGERATVVTVGLASSNVSELDADAIIMKELTVRG